MSSPSELPSASLNQTFIFKDTLWLGGKHDGYPRVPFNEYLEIRPKIFPKSSLGDVTELQCLLTFGLLEAALEVKIAENDLLQLDSNGRQVLTSKNFLALLRDWRMRIRQLADEDWEACRQWASRVQTTFTQAQSILNIETSKLLNNVFLRVGLEPHVMADILIQIGSIAEAVQCSYMAFPKEFGGKGFSWRFILAPVKWQYKTGDMFANGWCPFTVQTISESVCMLGYARTCKAPHIREPSIGHGDCTSELCVINMVDTSICEAKHVAETCECDKYQPSLEDVVGSLSSGKIPVFQCPPPHNELLSSDSLTTPYVAISHVWADGLTSTTEKGFPSCQIKRLVAMTSKILEDPGGALWIDALCIPAIKDVRNLAIELMAQTYRDAAAVLVIDSVIREISSSASREEKLFYVLASGWIQRLWTFQEAALAQKLFFEFSDGLVALEELHPVTEEDHFNTVQYSLASEVYRLTTYRWASGVGFRISDVVRSLRWRTTNRKADETLAVSGLLNLNAGELVKLPPEERMQTFLLRIGKLPRDIIFLSGKKLNKVGFRWAPRTFMRGVESCLDVYGPYEAFCTTTGLEAEYDVIIQDTVIDGEKDGQWCILDSCKQRIYKITDIYATSLTSYSCNTILLLSLPEPLQGKNCAGVLVDPDVVMREPVEGRDGDKISCEFKKLLYLKAITEAEWITLGKIRTVNAKSARMRVKVV